jgi:hypothetical protein
MDYKQAVKDQKGELSELHQRMDNDANLVNLKKYSLTDVNGKEVPRAISITLNDPAVFAANVESSLGKATEQVTVESEDEKLDTAYIEDAVKAALASASDRLTSRGDFPLNPFFDQQMCRRGRGAARCLFRIENDVLISDITYWDTRYMYYGMGGDGLDWAAYETKRSKGDIEAEYPDAKVTGKTGTILDIWTADHNEVYLDDRLVRQQHHLYGYVPVCFQIVPLGSMLADEGSMKYRGESIFFLIRDLLPELNRLVSLIQSLNQKELEHALQWMSEEGKTTTPPEYKDLDTPGTVISADKGGGAFPVPYGQLKQQAWLLHSMIETRIQRGSLSNFEYGTFTQPMSAVALITVGEGRDQVFLPRLGARGLLNQQLSYMLIDQLIKTGQRQIEIGTKGHKRAYDIRKLEGEYSIEFKYFITSPKIDAARFAMVPGAKGIIPDRAIRRDILQREDPDEDERLLRWEEAETLSPLIKMRRTIVDLLDMAERGDEDARIDAELLATEMGITLEQILRGEIPATQPAKTKPQKTGEGILPLFAEGGARSPETIGAPESSAKKAANIKGTPAEGA